MTRKRIVWKDNELRGKNIESTRDVTEELRQEWLWNSTVAIGFAEEMNCLEERSDGVVWSGIEWKNQEGE